MEPLTASEVSVRNQGTVCRFCPLTKQAQQSIIENACQRWSREKIGGNNLNHLSKHELNALLEAAKVNHRDYLMIHTAYLHGLRASEVVGLTTTNVRDGFLILQRLKGSLKTVQPASPILIDFVSTLEPGEKIFPLTRRQFQRVVHKYGRLAGIPEHKCHPHVLKHSIAMHTIKQAGIENVRQYLGHRSLASTGAYLKVSDEAASRAVASALASSVA